ncbi:U4/U6 small nuclear ribonucleoprotein prp4 [Coemansia sp. RSA 1804]|nr:U4/U6 small nuclear ribonucleoprotein prp4 [Coemansia sp. RSA 1804]
MRGRLEEFNAEEGEITDDQAAVSSPRSNEKKGSLGEIHAGSKPPYSSASASAALLSRTPLARKYSTDNKAKSEQRHSSSSSRVVNEGKSRRENLTDTTDKRTRRRSRSPSRTPRRHPSDTRKDSSVGQGYSSKDNASAASLLSGELLSAGSKPSAVANGAAGSTVDAPPSIDAGFKLSFENDEGAEEERALEERRRRRREIMKMHNRTQTDSPTTPPTDSVRNISRDTPEHGNSSTSPDADTSGVIGTSASEFALEKPYNNPSNGLACMEADGVSAADYNPNADSNADDMRHRMIANTAQNIDAKNSVEHANGYRKGDAAANTASVQNGRYGDDDDDDGFDMFSDADTVPLKPSVPKPLGGQAAKEAGTGSQLEAHPGMADSWDDAEGYYRIVVGELMDGRYLVQSFLGQGVFSSVVKALDTKNQHAPVAIKIIRQNELMHKAGLKEQRILERLAAADPGGKMHVVRLLGSFVHRNHLCLCFELMNLNLREIVRKYGRESGLNLQAVRVYAMHLLLALDLLRRCGVIHGDLKPDNCFVSEQRNNVKLGDLGSACDVSENEITPYLVSRFYRAPEIVLGMQYNCAIDMWSLGATLFELYTGKIMFPGHNNNHMLQLMMETRGHFPNRLLRRGQFWQQHFEDNGGNMLDFVSRTTDKLTGSEVVRKMAFAKPKADIKSRVLQATPAGSPSEDIQLALQFANLLDRCLELSPEKRITPIEALRHSFFSQK